MRADAILFSQAMVTTSKSLESDPTMAQALVPLDQVRRQVAAALFGPAEPVTQVGRFQVQKLIGTGGMGVVFAAIDPQLGRTVALKLLQPLTAGERARERLLREAQAMARLQHPNVVGVYEAGVHGEQVYLVMEYVEDGTLAEWLRVRARGWQEVVGVLAQAGEGLAAAHAAGLVHRDFKPKYRRPSQTAPQPTDRPHSRELGRFERVSLLRLAPRYPALPQILAKLWQRAASWLTPYRGSTSKRQLDPGSASVRHTCLRPPRPTVSLAVPFEKYRLDMARRYRRERRR